MKYDVVIAGAGPAGSTLARRLAGAGLEGLVLEKEFMPREKPCGGGITYKAARLLDFPWQDVIEDTVHTAVFSYQGKSEVTVRLKTPLAYMVTRSSFDRMLADRARQAGACLVEGAPVKDIAVENGLVTVAAAGETYHGRLFVGADGVNGRSAMLLGLHHPGETGPTLEAEVACPPEVLEQKRGTIRLDCGAVPWGYGWVFPKRDRLSTGVGAFTRKVKELKKLLGGFLAREGLGSARILSLRGYPIPSGGRKKRIHSRSALLIGDAAGLVDPFSGEGIYYAIKSAHLAAEAILDSRAQPEGAPGLYQSLVDRHVTAELMEARRLARVFYTFPRVAFGLVEKNPDIAGQLCQIVCGEGNYSGLKEAAAEVIRAILSRKRTAGSLPHH